MIKSYKYRLYPTAEQATMIDKTIGVCRLIYNLALQVKISAWENAGIRLSAWDIQSEIKDLRKEYDWIAEVSSAALCESVGQVDISFRNFFRGSGFPKFKSKRTGGSFRCHNNRRRIDWVNSTLSITKIDGIPIRLSRKFDGKIKTVTISRTPTGKYFASIIVEDQQEIQRTQAMSIAVGMDLGVKDFAVLSTGEKFANPKYLRQSIERLRVLQRRASKKKKGSKNRKKANLRVSLLHEKIANQRNDFLHKLSTKLISDNQTDTICLETLPVKNMIRNRKLAKSISDVSWSEFVRQLEYKGKWYGKNIIKIDRFYASSKTCSNCGHKKDELNLSEREWDCSLCGANHDRDINAAINIRNLGMGSPVVPVEQSAMKGCGEAGINANLNKNERITEPTGNV